MELRKTFWINKVNICLTLHVLTNKLHYQLFGRPKCEICRVVFSAEQGSNYKSYEKRSWNIVMDLTAHMTIIPPSMEAGQAYTFFPNICNYMDSFLFTLLVLLQCSWNFPYSFNLLPRFLCSWFLYRWYHRRRKLCLLAAWLA